MKLVYTTTRRVGGDAGGGVLTSPHDGRSFQFDADEFALAMLFDGTRSVDEVLDRFWRDRQVHLSRERLTSFLRSLRQAGLLELQSEADQRALGTEPGRGMQARSGGPAQHDRPRAGGAGGAGNLIRPLVGPGRGRRKSDLEARGRKPKILIRLPVRWLLPLGSLLILPMRNRFTLLLSIALMGIALYGLWVHQVEAFDDFSRMFKPITIVQTLLVSMVTVNLLGQLARAAALHERGGAAPLFGISLLFSIIPRFMTNTDKGPKLSSVDDAQYVIAATLSANFVLFSAATFTWLLTRESFTAMPTLFMGLSFLSGVRLLLNLNPLARRPGYFLLSAKLGAANLRGRAVGSVIGRSGRLKDRRGRRPGSTDQRREGHAAKVGLWLFGVAVIAYLIAVVVLVTVFLGGWLRDNWGGLGVVVFLVLIAVFVIDPLADRDQGKPRAQPARARSWALPRPLFGTLLVLAVLLWAGVQPYTFEVNGDFTLQPGGRAQVPALVAGQIVSVHVREGDQVQRGQVLAVMSADEETRGLQAAQAAIEALQAELELARAGASAEVLSLGRQLVETARTRAEFSKNRLVRTAKLDAGTGISPQDRADIERRAALDAEILKENARRLDILRAGTRPQVIAELEARIAKVQATRTYHLSQLEHTAIKAPADGRVISDSLRFAVGEYMQRGDLFAQIEDTRHLQMEIVVPQRAISEVQGGDLIQLKLRLLPQDTFQAVVKEVSPAADEVDGERVFRAVADVTNPDGRLKVGMSGVAKIEGVTEPAAVAFTRWLVRLVKVELWAWLP